MPHRLKFRALVLALGFGAVMPSALAASFSFGVMGDTQWKSNLDGENPGTAAVGIALQVQQQFINHQVKFVIQIGDLVDSVGTNAINLKARADAAQPLYDAGIGFFPLRGNHDSGTAAANYFPTLFPQTTGTANTWGASQFDSPYFAGASDPNKLKGLSYSFDYGNARFVLLDQFTRKDGSGSTNSNIVDQVDWIDTRLDGKGASNHGFVFAHKELIGQNHTDSLFGSNPASNATAQNAFIASLDENGVRYAIGGHDHMHHRSLVTSPDRNSQVQQIIASSNSYKFYVPANPTSKDEIYNVPNREQVVQQELYSIGYYIFNVDGPRVTVDYYASPTDVSGRNAGCGTSFATLKDCDLSVTPVLSFSKRETFGYSLNGKQFVIQPGQTFTGIADSSPTGAGWKGTEMAILAGNNAVSNTILDGRAVVQDVNTGWSEASGNQVSDVLSLWGMANTLGSDQTDPYVLSMRYDPTGLDGLVQAGQVYLMTPDAGGKWVNAVDLNHGGTKTFVLGAYNAAYGLGTFGVNPQDHTAWAVLNHGSDFAVAAVPEPEAYALMLAGLGLVGFMARRRQSTQALK